MPSDVPVRTELTVLPADDPSKREIGLVIRERNGVEIHKFEEGRKYERDEDGRWKDLAPITEEGDLRAGDKILVPGLMGELFVMSVEADKYGALTARGEHLSAVLEFGKDDRHAWVCVGLINLRGLQRLEIRTDES